MADLGSTRFSEFWAVPVVKNHKEVARGLGK